MPCHHVVERLARRHRVFYIDNFGGVRDLHVSDAKRAWRKLTGLRHRSTGGVQSAESASRACDEIVVDRPVIIPTPRIRLLQVINGWILNRRVKTLVREYQIEKPIIWTRLPIELVWRAISGVDRSLLRRAVTGAALTAGADEFGTRYVIDFEYDRGGRRARVRSCWIVKRGEECPRLTSCFVL